MAQRYLPNRTLSFEDRLEMASLGTDGYQKMWYRRHKSHSLIRRYTQQLLEDGNWINESQKYGEVNDCVNELGLKSPTRKKNNLD